MLELLKHWKQERSEFHRNFPNRVSHEPPIDEYRQSAMRNAISSSGSWLHTTMAALRAEPTRATILFRPTNRLRDMRREQRGDDSYLLPYFLREVELVLWLV
jgi:hypothetical protein